MKKLLGMNWGANSDILKKIYIGNLRPTAENGMSTSATASNIECLSVAQNTNLRLITSYTDPHNGKIWQNSLLRREMR